VNFTLIVRWKLHAVPLAILFCVPSLTGQNSPFISFGVTGVAYGGGYYPTSVNVGGTIVGYEEGSNGPSGFLRQPSGTIKGFLPTIFSNFRLIGINNSGQVLAFGEKNAYAYEYVGALRSATGQTTCFSVLADTATFPNGLNNAGVVAGMYQDSAQASHGFIRSADGSFTLFDDPDAVLAPWEGTTPIAINDSGTVAGTYNDGSTGTQRAFVRDQLGNFTNFDGGPPGAATTYVTGINSAGAVVGYYFFDTNSRFGGAFVRSATGEVTPILVPGAVSTKVAAISDSGVTVGSWEDSIGFIHGFERDASGNLTEIAASRAFLSVVPSAISNDGTITGYYVNDAFGQFGFVVPTTSKANVRVLYDARY
jgi:hypothetical protein